MPQGAGINGEAASVETILLTRAKAHQLQRETANPVRQSCWRKVELKGRLLHREVQIYPDFHGTGEKNPFSAVTDVNEETYKQDELVLGSRGDHRGSRSVWSALWKISLSVCA